MFREHPQQCPHRYRWFFVGRDHQRKLAIDARCHGYYAQALAIGRQGHFRHQGHADVFPHQGERTAPLSHLGAHIQQLQPGGELCPRRTNMQNTVDGRAGACRPEQAGILRLPLLNLFTLRRRLPRPPDEVRLQDALDQAREARRAKIQFYAKT